ncbi:MAG: hemerythrin domain-containing protein [Planctomycetes bacterium]|nr:hemerythrin domain-containing protein [Planctomycetota bacterium]
MSPSVAEGALQTWLAEAATQRQQPPHLELLAEHVLMTGVLSAMDREAATMVNGGPLRLEFWQDVVDFNGNFVHLSHRVKEESHLIPAMLAAGVLPADHEQAIRREHQAAKDLTLSLCDGVGEGDWEQVQRLVSLYVFRMRAHMSHEESSLLSHATRLSTAALARLRAGFDAVEAAALRGRSRLEIRRLAERISSASATR